MLTSKILEFKNVMAGLAGRCAGRVNHKEDIRLMGFVYFIVVGLVAGLLAGYIRKEKYSLPVAMGVGVAGAIAGGFLFTLFGLQSNTVIGSIIVSTGGAVALLFLLDQYKSMKSAEDAEAAKK